MSDPQLACPHGRPSWASCPHCLGINRLPGLSPEPATDMSRFDRDPDAVAWARAKVVRVRDQFRGFQQKAAAAGRSEQAEMWRRMANMLDLKLIGGTTCVITAFDERLPAMAKLRDGTDERNGE
jgi:hypothetical protein